MKHSIYITLLVVALCAAGSASAQMKTSYFMEGSVQRLDMNAAFIPQRGYVNIPFIGNLGLGYTSNAFSVRNFLYPNPDGSGLVTFMHSSVSADDFLKRLRNKNHFNMDLRENIFGFGGFAKRYFWSFNLNLRSESSFTIPKQFFALAKEFGTGEYNLNGFNISTNNYLEFAFGAAFPIRIVSKTVNVGVRAKLLMGIAQSQMKMDKMAVSINDQAWQAAMSGTVSGNVIGMDFLGLSGAVSQTELQDYIDNNKFNLGRMGGWGVAFDLGADTRFLDDRLKVSFGLNDLGFIAWSKKTAINATTNDFVVAFRGYDFEKKGIDTDDSELLLNIDKPHGITRMLTATLNLGGEYNILEEKIGFGLLSQTRFFGNYTSTELTVSANFRPINWFTASISHSLLHNRLGTFGVALNIHPSWINLFAGMDYVGFNYARYNSFKFIPHNQNSVNFYFGLSIPLSRPKQGGCFPVKMRNRNK